MKLICQACERRIKPTPWAKDLGICCECFAHIREFAAEFGRQPIDADELFGFPYKGNFRTRGKATKLQNKVSKYTKLGED